MSFYEVVSSYRDFDFEGFFSGVSSESVRQILAKDNINDRDFLALLSPAAQSHLEQMAEKARRLSLNHFGKAVLLYAPIYISNYCINRCAYCGFNHDNGISRKKLSMEEIAKEAREISKTGIRHVLLLTGESRKHSPADYITEAAGVLRKHFDSVTIEVSPLTLEEYVKASKSGIDGVTIYQETYDEQVYDEVHISGPKKDYRFRLDTPERACKANMRSVNVGALLGLSGNWRRDAFMTGMHANYLQDKYASTELSVSFPRIRPHAGVFERVSGVSDIQLVQTVLAMRLFMPHVSQNISTREHADFRDNLIPLGINKFSAGSCTEVGGYSGESATEAQFEISDGRSVDEVCEAILAKGYQPLFKNWMSI